ncbi:MAG TPA: helix-turn-helix transcriptional regulator [Bacteroidales bacterium]|jgi:transcriptional regulator with XRE-family HTH domain|nr:helix-turn-helix transcriptional regulator [Bacteroidales bacterium]HPT10465.1 helix-turn-helix transcriptional regulator [Bacteroidales bacterium]
MIDRITTLMKEYNLTASQFADEIGIQRSGMSHLLSGRNKPSLDFVMKVLKRFPEVTAGWLIQGVDTPGEDFTPVVEHPVTTQKTLFDEPMAEEPQELPENKKTTRLARKERTEKRIEKIVVLYNDRTFREYESD